MLPTVPCSEFLHLVIPQCPTCPDPIASHMVRRAAITFCEITKAWRHTGSQDIASNNETLIAPDHTTIHTIEQATLNGQALTPVMFLDSEPPQLTGIMRSGMAEEISQVEPGVVQVNPFQAGTLRYSLTLKPRSDRLMGTFPADPLSDARDVLPAFIFDNHAETIAKGALSMILMIPRTSFTDPTKGMLYRQEFMDLCNSAHADARMGQQRAPRRNRVHWL